jgi:hypothetical protein
MIQQFHVLNRGIAVLVFVAAGVTSLTAGAETAVYVADVEHLYAAVNAPANAGAAIILAPGTYVLTMTDAAGVTRPNGGRLELTGVLSTNITTEGIRVMNFAGATGGIVVATLSRNRSHGY